MAGIKLDNGMSALLVVVDAWSAGCYKTKFTIGYLVSVVSKGWCML